MWKSGICQASYLGWTGSPAEPPRSHPLGLNAPCCPLCCRVAASEARPRSDCRAGSCLGRLCLAIWSPPRHGPVHCGRSRHRRNGESLPCQPDAPSSGVPSRPGRRRPVPRRGDGSGPCTVLPRRAGGADGPGGAPGPSPGHGREPGGHSKGDRLSAPSGGRTLDCQRRPSAHDGRVLRPDRGGHGSLAEGCGVPVSDLRAAGPGPTDGGAPWQRPRNGSVPVAGPRSCARPRCDYVRRVPCGR